MSKKYLSITDLYIRAISESEDKDWNDNIVKDISEEDNSDILMNKLAKLIDAEYESIKDYSKEDLFIYAKENIPNMTKEISDIIWERYLS